MGTALPEGHATRSGLVRMHVCVHMILHLYVYVCMYVCVHVFLYVCMYVCMHVLCVYV